MLRKDQIYTSSNYDDFVFKKENRLVNEKKANRIAEKMKECGWIGSPIEISVTESGKYQIEDGQHRYVASKKTNTPIKFMVVEPRRAYEQAELNDMVSKWNKDDYIDMYARDGIDSYIKMQNLINEFPEFSLTLIRRASSHGGGTGNDLVMREGRLKISDAEYIKARNALSDLKEINHSMAEIGFKSSIYDNVLVILLLIGIIDKDRLIDKIEKYGATVLEKVSTANRAVDYIERLYNYNTKTNLVYITDAYKRAKRKKEY